MAEKLGLCHICGRIARRACRLCGRFACDIHIDAQSILCSSCRAGKQIR